MANGRRPDYVVRAKQSPDSEYWNTIGAAWSFLDGKPGYAIRLHTIPVMWTGEFILVPPLDENGEKAQHPAAAAVAAKGKK
jgi:hypothetical protein